MLVVFSQIAHGFDDLLPNLDFPTLDYPDADLVTIARLAICSCNSTHAHD